MAKELSEVAVMMDADPSVRSVVLLGQGKAFCAGGDLAAIHQAVKSGGASAGELKLKQMTGHLHMAISRE